MDYTLVFELARTTAVRALRAGDMGDLADRLAKVKASDAAWREVYRVNMAARDRSAEILPAYVKPLLERRAELDELLRDADVSDVTARHLYQTLARLETMSRSRNVIRFHFAILRATQDAADAAVMLK